jgi:asparagine synthase (glutamine-hydrolysing)
VCGILGLIGKNHGSFAHTLSIGVRALAHRGPDDEGTVLLPLRGEADYYAGLGSRRLAILDLSASGHQPMHDVASGTWLVFNGEIYNFREIREKLEKLGHKFSSQTDTEVILKAYCEWGDACLGCLRGMFAFAIWDDQRQRLLVARDRFGVKPVYYYFQSGFLIFGSEVRALLATDLIPRRVCSRGLASYLEFGSVQDPLTMLEDVRSLPAGRFLVWENNCCKEHTYWSAVEVANRYPATDSPEEASKAVCEILSEAVSLRLIADVPLGVFLSGGVDSTSISLLAQEAETRPLQTFSIVFDERDHSEESYSDLVARTLRTHHHKIKLTEQELFNELPGMMSSMDQPSIDGLNTYMISKATKGAGVTVALSGLGADELFCGYPTFRHVPRLMALQDLLLWASPLWRALRRVSHPLEANGLTKLIELAANGRKLARPYSISRRLFTEGGVTAILQENLRHEYLMSCASSSGSEDGLSRLDAINQVSVLEATTYMANTLLRDTDVMSMAHSFEIRSPFLDHKLWEYVLPLRAWMKIDRRLPKPLLLKALSFRVPEAVYARPKMGFGLPFDAWIKGKLRAEIEQELAGNHEGFPVIDRRAGRVVWRHFLGGRTNWTRPWSLFVLQRWLRHNLYN